MSVTPKVSVAMAVFNGMPYLKEQLDTILANLSDTDEIVISDDGSTDRTIELIKEYQSQYPQIRFVKGPEKGIKQNFANAIQNCTGAIIFLSDQDDIWNENKIKTVLPFFDDPMCMVVTHNAQVIYDDGITDGPSTFQLHHSRSGILRNIWKNSYMGCCMAFRKELVPYILPIPDDIEMHDQWIGLIGEKLGKSIFLDRKLIDYRRHSQNASELHHHPFPVMVSRRVHLIRRFIQRIKEWDKPVHETI